MNNTEFCLNSDILHFNHAGIAPWPRKTVEAVRIYAEENALFGTLHADKWEQRTMALRKLLAQLIGADSPREIALTKNTSEGLSMIAAGIDWQAGDNIIVGNLEFPSNRLVWETLAQRFQVDVRLADFSTGDHEDALLSCMDEHTRLLTVSSIQYTTGYKIDLERLGKQCRENNTLFCVDAIQSLGAVPFNVQTCHADFVCADGHKWLMSPEGTGIFYCKTEHLSSLNLQQFGWHMTDKPTQYENPDWSPALSARRFECGSMNNLGLCALHASLSLFFEIGLDNIYRKVARNISYLIDKIDKETYDILTPQAAEKHGGIVTLRHKSKDNNVLFQELCQQQILCAQRANGIRLSPHFYTSQQHIDQLLDYLNQS